MEVLKNSLLKQRLLLDLARRGEVKMSNDGQGVIISFKEIYDEVQKTSAQIESIGKRVENVEKKMEQQEKQQEENARRKWDYESRLKVGVILALVPFVIMVTVYLSKEGVFG